MLLNLRNVGLTYNPKTPLAKTALRDISLEVSEGQTLAIVGPIGSGKSTLAQIMAGLLMASSGEAYFEGKLFGTAIVVKDVWKNVGMVFQNPESQLFEKTVFDDVAFGPRNLGLPNLEVKKRVEEALGLVGLNYRKLKGRSPFSLSGGEKRRVAIAGILAIRPKVLILDEPTVGLDPQGKGLLLAYLQTIHQDRKTSLILITHDMEEVSFLTDRVIVLDAGRVVFDASPTELFRQHELLTDLGLELPEDWQIKHRLAICGYDISLNMPLSAVKTAILKQAMPEGRQVKP